MLFFKPSLELLTGKQAVHCYCLAILKKLKGNKESEITLFLHFFFFLIIILLCLKECLKIWWHLISYLLFLWSVNIWHMKKQNQWNLKFMYFTISATGNKLKSADLNLRRKPIFSCLLLPCNVSVTGERKCLSHLFSQNSWYEQKECNYEYIFPHV